MLKSFSYIFKDKAFLKHFFMLFLFVLTSNFLTNLSSVLDSVLGKFSIWYNIVLIAGYIVMFIPYGYSMELLKLNIKDKEGLNALDMDVFKNFKDGFKVVVSGLLLVVSVLILFIILGFISRLLSDKFGIMGTSFVFTFVFLIFLIISFLMIAMCCRYVVKPSWLNFLDLKSAGLLINNNVAQYFKVYALSALLIIMLCVITIFLTIVLTKIGFAGFVLYNILVSFIWTYLTFVFAKLFAYAVDVEKI